MSNRLSVLVAEVQRLHREAEAHSRDAADKAIKTGLALIEAKELVKHGEWASWLSGAFVSERTAQRYMQLARSGFKSDTVADLGGIKCALAFLSSWQPPQGDSALFIQSDTREIAYVWEDRTALGHFHVVAICGDDKGQWIKSTIKPMLWHVEIDGEQPINLIAAFLDHVGFPSRLAGWLVEPVERRLAEVFCPTLFD